MVRFRATKLALCAAITLALGLAASSASAATCAASGNGNGNQNVLYEVTPPAGGACYASGEGNTNGDKNDEFLKLNLAKSLNLKGIAKTGDGAFGSQFWSTTPVTDATKGTFQLSAIALAAYSNFVVALKSGDTWAAFLVNASQLYNWSITREGDGKELSHATLYASMAAVPIPAGVVLLGTGLAALGLLRRRQRKLAA